MIRTRKHTMIRNNSEECAARLEWHPLLSRKVLPNISDLAKAPSDEPPPQPLPNELLGTYRPPILPKNCSLISEQRIQFDRCNLAWWHWILWLDSVIPLSFDRTAVATSIWQDVNTVHVNVVIWLNHRQKESVTTASCVFCFSSESIRCTATHWHIHETKPEPIRWSEYFSKNRCKRDNPLMCQMVQTRLQDQVMNHAGIKIGLLHRLLTSSRNGY